MKEANVKLNADKLELIIYALEDAQTEHKRILATEERKLLVGGGREPNPDHTYGEIGYQKLQIEKITPLLVELSEAKRALI